MSILDFNDQALIVIRITKYGVLKKQKPRPEGMDEA
jgi:hypothetical protein